ncbi:MAG: bluetail domain-containing putative surface protein [Cyanobacteria bacterium P01_G01_bin.4]
MKGNAGYDTLVGGAGAELLNGGTNNDLLIGGSGNDFMLGQQGRDRFRYNNFREGRDTIAGFNAREDRIEISLTGFQRGLTRGVLKSNQFSLGPPLKLRTDFCLRTTGCSSILMARGRDRR